MSEIKGLSNEEANQYLKSPDPATTEFIMQQTMYRIKDPRKTLEFYSGVLGMRLLKKLDFPEMQFSIYFMGFEKEEDFPKDNDKLIEWVLTRRATIELCHNWGSESDPELKYHNGNSEPRGFGHIGISVPDVDAACKRFETLNVEFTKKPNDGKMKGIAFIKDPDGYLIEIFDVKGLKKIIS